MYTLKPDEKTSAVMAYSRNKLIHGDLVTKEGSRVSVWLRTQGVPNYIHLLKAQVLFFGSTPPKSLTYNEYFFPTERIIGFHLAPPTSEQLDYDPGESNRTMVDVNLMVGAFTLKGKMRISTMSDFATSIEVARMIWASVYDADISSPFLPQMPVIHVPMLLVNSSQVSFAL
ncbi:MAG: hypothetical protein A2Z03_00215 [Chloroflexi bacterium RBG_16_56_8]|nr:MAG: hypothetical protein A2Z03_00215 [Chloroflexi bacterium RBG_16_56_8]